MAFLELRNVSKSYTSGDKRLPVLENINLKVEEGNSLPSLDSRGAERRR